MKILGTSKFVIGILFITMGFTTSCNSGSGLTPSASDPIKLSSPGSDASTSPVDNGTTPQPQSQPDAKEMWKQYRALYKIISRNQKPVCTEGSRCQEWADRLDPSFHDPNTFEVIPQVLAWNLILRESSSTSTTITVPLFSDRGSFSTDGQTLIYDFAGRVYEEGSGSYSVKAHFTAQTKENGHVLLHLDYAGPGGALHDDFELVRVSGTDLVDPPAGLVPGPIAVYEQGVSQGAYRQVVRCKISYTPDSPYLILARAEVSDGGHSYPIGGMKYKVDSKGLFSSAMALWSSHGTHKTETPSQGPFPGPVLPSEYWGVYAYANGKPYEIPVDGYGVGLVTNDASSEAKASFTAIVKDICDQIKPFNE